ncbi:MAG: YbjQ family protein [Eubacterium sp.]|nr:YbjQ family protein [Eubacterium sp.]
MIIVNTNKVEGYEMQTLGLVQGSTIQSKNMFKDMGAGFKSMVGGELTSYTKMMEEAREVAIKRMIDKATSLGADAIVNVRFNSASVMQGAAEIMAYGTAVKLIKE